MCEIDSVNRKKLPYFINCPNFCTHLAHFNRCGFFLKHPLSIKCYFYSNIPLFSNFPRQNTRLAIKPVACRPTKRHDLPNVPSRILNGTIDKIPRG